MPFDKYELADNLRGFRAKKRMSQSEVASAVGVSETTIANYENGKGGLGFETAWALADLFGVPLCDLGGRDESEFAAKRSAVSKCGKGAQ